MPAKNRWNCEWTQDQDGTGRILFRREGMTKTLSCAAFPIWTDGRLQRIPVTSLTRKGGQWIACGSLKTETGAWEAKDTLTPRGNTLVVDRTWRYRGEPQGSVRLGMDIEAPFPKLDYWAMPFISMNGNEGSRTVPRGMTFQGEPWIFREERTTAPGLMTLEAAGTVAGSYTEPGRTEDRLCACSLIRAKGGHTLRTFFPFREGPRTFLGAAFPGNSTAPEQGLYTGGSGFGRGLAVGSKARFQRRFHVVLDKAGERRHGYARVWESAWQNVRAPLAPPVNRKKTEARLWKSLTPFWVQRGTACGFVTRVDRDGDPLGGFSPTLGAGWCAPTMMLAWLSIRRAIRKRRPALAEQAIRATEFFIEQAPRKNGAFKTHFNLRDMQWTAGGLDAVQMGGAAYWLLRCAALLRDTRLFANRIDTEQWTRFALDFCDLAVRTQRRDGAFVGRFDAEGRCIAYERTMGVHAARAVLEAYRWTGERAWLRAAERGADYYIRSVIDREKDYGDCTDILNNTTENDAASVPDFLIDLYRETGKRRYLKKAVRAAEYSLSYMYAYNLHFPPETECGRRAMKTRGFSAISPETGFVCFWFVLQSHAFLDLWKETGERRWKDYAAAVIRASLQMMAEPGDMFGLAKGLEGCRAEVIAVLDTVKGGHVWKKGMTGYTWHQPVWWPAAFNLLNFAFIEDHYPAFMKNIEGSIATGPRKSSC